MTLNMSPERVARRRYPAKVQTGALALPEQGEVAGAAMQLDINESQIYSWHRLA